MDPTYRERYERLASALARERRRGRVWALALMLVGACALLPAAPGSHRAQRVVLLEDGQERGVLDADLRLKAPGACELWVSSEAQVDHGVGLVLRAASAVAAFDWMGVRVDNGWLGRSMDVLAETESSLHLSAGLPFEGGRPLRFFGWNGDHGGGQTFHGGRHRVARTLEEYYFTAPFLDFGE